MIIYSLFVYAYLSHAFPSQLTGHKTTPTAGCHQGKTIQMTIFTQQLQQKVEYFITLGLAPTTRATYSAGWKKFSNFCTQAHLTPIPVSKHTLLLFATSLATTGISHGTIKVYLSAICHIHVLSGLHELLNDQYTPWLQLALIGIKRSQAASSPPRTHLPINLQMIQKLKQLLSQLPSSYDNTMLWAACCLAFFSFLWVNEFTVSNQQDYDGSTHLSLNDMSVDNWANPRLIRVHIKQSKTDPFRQGTDVYLSITDNPIYLIAGLIPYLTIREAQPGPLFMTSNHRYLTRAQKLNEFLHIMNHDSGS